VGLPIVRIDSENELRRYCDDVIPNL
jgi:hypothetical protein